MNETNGKKSTNKHPDYNKTITDDYECEGSCRNCPFPGAKCYLKKYNRYNTKKLLQKQQGGENGF